MPRRIHRDPDPRRNAHLVRSSDAALLTPERSLRPASSCAIPVRTWNATDRLFLCARLLAHGASRFFGTMSKKKLQQLGMPIGTASHRLRKIVYVVVQRLTNQKTLRSTIKIRGSMCPQTYFGISKTSHFPISSAMPWQDAKRLAGSLARASSVRSGHSEQLGAHDMPNFCR